MATLTVAVDPVALLREGRHHREPDPAQAVVLAELAGATGISVQLRRDRRFVRDRDLYILREMAKSRLIIECAPSDDMLNKLAEVKPSGAVLVADQADPDLPVGGIDFNVAPIDFADITRSLKGSNISVCFFVEPDMDAVKGAAKSGADAVMINCTSYTTARNLAEAQEELDRIDGAVQFAKRSNVTIMAGRGIDFTNIRPLLELGLINEYVIGHAIAARAMLTGYQAAVTEMVRVIGQSAASR